jgi:hypothetical protein
MTTLKCKVKKGVFRDESVVEIRTADGREVSFYVPLESVRHDDRVVVRVVRTGTNIWATLPTAMPHNAILVRPSDLVEEETLSA